MEHKVDTKMETNIQTVEKHIQNVSTIKAEVKTELDEVKSEMEVKSTELVHTAGTVGRVYMDSMGRVITQNLTMQVGSLFDVLV